MPHLNTQNSDLHGQAPREPQTLGASEFRSAMHEMASTIVQSIRVSNRLMNDNLRNLASNIHPTTSQTTAIQNSQARVRDRHRISRMSRRRHSEIRNTVNYSDSSEIDDDIGLSGATDSSNRIWLVGCVEA